MYNYLLRHILATLKNYVGAPRIACFQVAFPNGSMQRAKLQDFFLVQIYIYEE